MAARIPSYKIGMCAVCDKDLHPAQPRVTHVGGENHVGFHKKCYTDLLKKSGFCPHDGQLLDQSSVVSRTEKVRDRVFVSMLNGFAASTLASTILLVGISAGEFTSLATGWMTGGLTASALDIATELAVKATALVAPITLGLEVIQDVPAECLVIAVGSLASTLGGAWGNRLIEEMADLGNAKNLALVSVTGATIGTAVATKLINWFYDFYPFSESDRKFVRFGAWVGMALGERIKSLTGIRTFRSLDSMQISGIPAISLVSGVAAAAFSFFRGYT